MAKSCPSHTRSSQIIPSKSFPVIQQPTQVLLDPARRCTRICTFLFLRSLEDLLHLIDVDHRWSHVLAIRTKERRNSPKSSFHFGRVSFGFTMFLSSIYCQHEYEIVCVICRSFLKSNIFDIFPVLTIILSMKLQAQDCACAQIKTLYTSRAEPVLPWVLLPWPMLGLEKCLEVYCDVPAFYNSRREVKESGT